MLTGFIFGVATCIAIAYITFRLQIWEICDVVEDSFTGDQLITSDTPTKKTRPF